MIPETAVIAEVLGTERDKYESTIRKLFFIQNPKVGDYNVENWLKIHKGELPFTYNIDVSNNTELKASVKEAIQAKLSYAKARSEMASRGNFEDPETMTGRTASVFDYPREITDCERALAVLEGKRRDDYSLPKVVDSMGDKAFKMIEAEYTKSLPPLLAVIKDSFNPLKADFQRSSSNAVYFMMRHKQAALRHVTDVVPMAQELMAS